MKAGVPQITGETRLLAVIGRPVAHSLSPRIHNKFASDLGLNYAYLAFDIGQEELDVFLSAARLLKIAGFNLTMPLKEAVLPLLDGIDQGAEQYGAVNTVVLKDNGFYGYNTDGAGFIVSLKSKGFDPSTGNALILGAGGAAKAVALALNAQGMRVKMASRRASQLSPVHPNITYCSWSDLTEATKGCSLLVNATPLGMHGVQDDFTDLSFLNGLNAGSVVYDLIYAPRETTLLKNAKAKGFSTVNGLLHLLYQAALSFEFFTGHTPLKESVEALAKEFED